MRKIMVTGARGQLGQDLMIEIAARGLEAIGLDQAEMDITCQEQVMQCMQKFQPDAVIHCAAWTAVDAAEDNAEACRRVNALGTEHIAKACQAVGAKMLYLSTDYIFDGQGERPWEPDDQVTKPLNVYGLTKYEGELAVRKYVSRFFIVRIAWVFGPHGKNFVRTMLQLAESRDHLTVVNDQFGTPTYTPDLAKLLMDMIQTDKYGIYHATNEGGYISWYDFAKEIFAQAGKTVQVSPVDSTTFAAKAKRPQNSRLSKKKLVDEGFTLLPDWKDALQRFLLEIEKEV